MYSTLVQYTKLKPTMLKPFPIFVKIGIIVVFIMLNTVALLVFETGA